MTIITTIFIGAAGEMVQRGRSQPAGQAVQGPEAVELPVPVVYSADEAANSPGRNAVPRQNYRTLTA